MYILLQFIKIYFIFYVYNSYKNKTLKDFINKFENIFFFLFEKFFPFKIQCTKMTRNAVDVSDQHVWTSLQ